MCLHTPRLRMCFLEMLQYLYNLKVLWMQGVELDDLFWLVTLAWCNSACEIVIKNL